MIRALALLGAALAAPVVAYLTGFFTVWVSNAHEQTVGSISFKGFPIPFYEAAPGISIMGGWHPQLLCLNIVAWEVILLTLAIRWTRRNSLRP